MSVDGSWLFYWFIAAVVLAPIVLIVKGLAAGKRGDIRESRGRDVR
jgi:hypothetical protein